MQSRNELNKLFDGVENEGSLREMLEAVNKPEMTPMKSVSKHYQKKVETLSLDEVHEIPKTFRKKLEANKEPMSEDLIKQIYVFTENLRKKGHPKGVIRNSVKREFGILEYD